MYSAHRVHEFDGVRSIAVLLGVVYHAALFGLMFGPPAGGRSAEILWGTAYSVAGFNMPLFFLVAGFFAALTLRKRDVRSFVSTRLQRIGIPLVVGLVTIVPATSAAFSLADPALNTPILGWPLALGHLWFLWYLILLYAIALGVRWVSHRLGLRPDGIRTRLPRGRWWLVPAVITTALLLWPMHTTVIDTPTSFVPNLPILGSYGLFFGVGWALHARRDPVAYIGRGWVPALAATVVLAIAGWKLSRDAIEGTSTDTVMALTLLVYALLAWMAIIAFVGLMGWAVRTERPAVRYVSDASYWLFLVHPPVVILSVSLLRELGAHPLIAFVGANVITFALVLASYAGAVRHTLIGRVLDGPRHGPIFGVHQAAGTSAKSGWIRGL